MSVSVTALKLVMTHEKLFKVNFWPEFNRTNNGGNYFCFDLRLKLGKKGVMGCFDGSQGVRLG